MAIRYQCSSVFDQLINGMLQKEPALRVSYEEIGKKLEQAEEQDLIAEYLQPPALQQSTVLYS